MEFTARKEDIRTIHGIAKRAVELAYTYGKEIDLLTMHMDIDACHSNGNPLRLGDLLAADDGNFGHDVFGIRGHMNRDTGQLESCFSPRYSA